MAVRPAGGWDIPGDRLGGVGNAAPHGHLFPSVYVVGGSGLPAPGGLRAGPRLSAGGNLRKAGADHVHVLGVRRLRCHWLPHHRQPQGAAGGQPYRLPGALQREISHPHCPHHHVFCGRTGGPVPFSSGGGAVTGDVVAGGGGHPGLLQAVVLYGAAGSPLILYLGTAPLPQATGRPGAGALGAGSDSLRAGAGQRRWLPRRGR